MSLTVVFKGLFHRVCFCHQLLLLFFGRPALRLFLRTPVLFFLFQDIPNCCFGYAQYLCNASDWFSLFSQLQITCFSPIVLDLNADFSLPTTNAVFGKKLKAKSRYSSCRVIDWLNLTHGLQEIHTSNKF